jgi:hypothetical protein
MQEIRSLRAFPGRFFISRFFDLKIFFFFLKKFKKWY